MTNDLLNFSTIFFFTRIKRLIWITFSFSAIYVKIIINSKIYFNQIRVNKEINGPR